MGELMGRRGTPIASVWRVLRGGWGVSGGAGPGGRGSIAGQGHQSARIAGQRFGNPFASPCETAVYKASRRFAVVWGANWGAGTLPARHEHPC